MLHSFIWVEFLLVAIPTTLGAALLIFSTIEILTNSSFEFSYQDVLLWLVPIGTVYGTTALWTMFLSSARAKSREDVIALRWKKVAPGIAHEARRRGPGAAAQHLARAEPGCRVFFIGIGLEVGIGEKIARGPFPHVTEHLAAAEGAVAFGEGADIEAADTIA